MLTTREEVVGEYLGSTWGVPGEYLGSTWGVPATCKCMARQESCSVISLDDKNHYNLMDTRLSFNKV
jgi:hypothetical protein